MPGLRTGGLRLSHVRHLTIDLRPLREAPAYRWLWTGDVFATFGRQFTNVAVPFQVYALTGSSLMVGLVSLAQVVPLIAGSLAGGVVVDAHDRRRVILLTQVVMLVIALGLSLNAALPNPRLWPIFVLSTVQAVASGFDSPARRAALPKVVGLHLLAPALALQQMLNNLGKLLGPALAGILITAFSVSVVFLLQAVTFALGMVTVSRLPALRPEGGGRKAGWSSLKEGLAYVGSNSTVRSILLVDLSAMVFGLPRALFPAIGTGTLGGGATTVGLLYSAPGAGALLGALTSGWVGRVRRMGRAVLVSASLYALAMVGFGASRWLAVSLACLVVAGAADMVSAVFRNTMLQLTTPDALRGRVSSVNKAVVSGGPLLGDARAGALATLTSAGVAVVSGGLACLGTLGYLALRFPQLRHADTRNSDIPDEPPGGPGAPRAGPGLSDPADDDPFAPGPDVRRGSGSTSEQAG